MIRFYSDRINFLDVYIYTPNHSCSILHFATSKSDRIVIIYFICQFVTLGFLPSCIINHWRYGIIYILTIYLGIGIIVPSEPFIAISNKSEFYGTTICISIAAFVLFVWIAHNIFELNRL